MKKIKKLVALGLSLVMCLSTTIFAKPTETTTYKEIIKGDMNGVATEIEVTIYNYLGQLTFDCPIIDYNENFTETILTTEEKTFHVARFVKGEPQISFKMLKGSNLIQSAFSYPGSLSYGYGDIYSDEEGKAQNLPQGFYGSGQIGEGSGDAHLSSIQYFCEGIGKVGMDYFTADFEAFGYVTMDDILLITPEEEENFLKTGALNEWNTFEWPGLKELLTGASTAKPSENKSIPSTSTSVTAQKVATQVKVDGTTKTFDAYLINNNNYFKLRDFAYAVNGSEKQFSVSWDNAKKAISLTSSAAYEPQGTELALTSGNQTVHVTNSPATLYIDGLKVDLSSYVINGNTYFKLRDMAKLFNIGIGFDPSTGTVSIDTTHAYTE